MVSFNTNRNDIFLFNRSVELQINEINGKVNTSHFLHQLFSIGLCQGGILLREKKIRIYVGGV